MSSPETAASALVITFFGPMQVRVQGILLPPFRSRKTSWVLALLTLRHDRPVQREWLAASLWPDLEQKQAFANLRPVLSELRSALGSEAQRLRSPGRPTLLLDLTAADVDVVRFDAAIKNGSLNELERAVTLYGGPLLEGCQEEWIPQERSVREQNCLQALQKLGVTALAAGNFDAAVGYYQRAAGLDPLSDSARRGWMEALANKDDRNAAVQVYREFLNVLRSHPTAAPDEQTQALYQRLRAEARQQVSAPVVARVKSEAAPRVTGYLPHALTDLVGREDESLDISARLRKSRLVTLTGMGGIGKTRLAMAVASESVEEYADGVWLVALEALTDGSLVAQQIASLLGLKEEPERSLVQTLTEHLRKKRLLLVLDNCEHLLEASAKIIASLLRECLELRILTTSRERLGITGEAVWAVPSLATPDPAHLPPLRATLLRVLMDYESIQLFVERAQSVLKTFLLTESNARAVAEVCFRLEGIPLAIELAATRVKTLTVEQIAARLNNELGLLAGGNKMAAPRQLTLQATLDWSYTLLTDQEQRLLHRLSVFAGGWTLEAAEQVCLGEASEIGQDLNLLTSLVEKSLISFEEREGEIGGRYRMLEMVRQFTATKLPMAGEAEQCRDRHLACFLALAEEAAPQLKGSDQGTRLQRLETEYDNLRAALLWSAIGTQDAEYGLRLTGALWWFWSLRGYLSEGRRYIEAALAREGAHAETGARAKALTGAGGFAMDQGDYAASQGFYEECLGLYRRLADRQGVASALNSLGNLANRQNNHAAAFAFYQESLGIHRELDNLPGVAIVLGNLGNNLRQQGDYASAQTLFEESLHIRRQRRDKYGIGLVLANMGHLAILQGDYVTARADLEESLEIRQRLGDKSGIASTLFYLGMVMDAHGDYAAARELLEKSLALRRELGQKQRVAYSLNHLGNVGLHEYHISEARGLFQESLVLFQELRDQDGIAVSLHYLGDAACQAGEYVVARKHYRDSLGRFCEVGDKEGMTETLRDLASVLAAQAESEKATRLWGAAEVLRESIGVTIPPFDQKIYDRLVEKTRSALGEDAFAAVWTEGCALTREQAVTLALSEEGDRNAE